MNSTDEEIVNLYKKGDKDAFKILIERYTTPIFNFIKRHGILEDAEDITQEIFIKVWKNIKKFDGEKASFKTWIFAVARNTSIDFLRKKKTILFSELAENKEESFIENIPDNQLLPNEILQKLQDKKFLENLLNNLSFEYREILMLYYMEEMTFNEIGIVLNKSINTVKSQHRRAIQKLRKIASQKFYF